MDNESQSGFFDEFRNTTSAVQKRSENTILDPQVPGRLETVFLIAGTDRENNSHKKHKRRKGYHCETADIVSRVSRLLSSTRGLPSRADTDFGLM